MATPRITKHNIMEHLSHVVFGGALSKYSIDLKNALNDFRSLPGMGDIVSHQVVQNWCEKGQQPNRSSSYGFVKNFLEQRVQPDQLPKTRKDAYAQIVAFCAEKLQSAAPNGAMSKFVNGGIPAAAALAEDLALLYHELPGTYLTYRMRFTDRTKKPVAQELLQIRNQDGKLGFVHWFRRDETVQKYEGTVSLIGNIIWFFGLTPKFPIRLRVMHFRYDRDENAAQRQIRWGLLSSGIPESADEPVSCRIIIEKENITVADEDSIKPFVIFCDKDYLAERNRRDLIRFVENNTTAYSAPGTFSPAWGDDQKPALDELLTVDQRTIKAYATFLYPDDDSPR